MSKYILYTEKGIEVKNSKRLLEKHFGGSFYIKTFDKLNADMNGFIQHLFVNGVRLLIFRKKV